MRMQQHCTLHVHVKLSRWLEYSMPDRHCVGEQLTAKIHKPRHRHDCWWSASRVLCRAKACPRHLPYFQKSVPAPEAYYVAVSASALRTAAESQ